MRVKYFVGLPHHKIHSRFVHSVLGGDYVTSPSDVKDKTFPREIFTHDGEDVIWFFNDLYFHLHPLLKGKQVLVPHGAGFKKWFNVRRILSGRAHIDRFFSPDRPFEEKLKRAWIDPAKVRRVGYLLLFEIPHLEVIPNAVLFTSDYWKDWNHFHNLAEILKRLDPAIQGYLTIHPQTPARLKEPLLAAARGKKNITYLQSQEELLQAFAFCQAAVGGISSVLVPFFYFGKPVIFLRGRLWKNFYRGLGWTAVKNWVGSHAFDRILAESIKISDWREFGPPLLERARPSVSAKEIFYPHNFDRERTVKVLKQCVEELA